MRYPVEVFWSDEDGGYITVVPDLPGVLGVRRDAGGGGARKGDAIEAWIAACRQAGEPRAETDHQSAPSGIRVVADADEPRAQDTG